MISETKRKIHFLQYNPKKARAPLADAVPTVSVSTKYNKLVFGGPAIRETGMSGKFVRVYYEPNRKIIGWQVKDKLEHYELKSWKLCRPNAIAGTWNISITKMLAEMRGLKKDKTYSNLPVQKYREMAPLSEHNGEIFFFVEVKEQDEVTSD